MIRWLWSRIMKWGWDFGRKTETEDVVLGVANSSRNSEPIVRINLHVAMNGKILEIATPSPNRQHDWVVTNYIVTDGESLTEALTMLLIAKGVK